MPTLDCVVVIAEQGHGKRSDVLSDYTFAVRDESSGPLRVIGKAYSGLTDDEIEELTAHFKRHTLRRNGGNTTSSRTWSRNRLRRDPQSPRHDSGLALRFPRIKAIRHDKSVADIDTLQSASILL